MRKVILFCALGLALLGGSSAAEARRHPADRHCLSWQMREALERIEGRWGRVQVISTCRPGARVRGTGRPSLHASGRAVDFRVAPGMKAQVVRWLMANHEGGVMTYRRSSHIHVDVGRRFVRLGARG